MTAPNVSLLGRRKEHDPESRRYPLRLALGAALPEQSKLWAVPTLMDQGVRLQEFPTWNPSGCTGFSRAHVLMADPAPIACDPHGAYSLYQRAQELDDFADTPPAEGSSVLGAVKAAQELGDIQSYWWGFTLDEVIASVPTVGPGVAGTVWLDSMWRPDERGFVHIDGNEVGGHAYAIGGLLLELNAFVIYQSWGPGWSEITDPIVLAVLDRYRMPVDLRSHVGLISFDDLWALLQRGGEYCVSLDYIPSDPLQPIDPAPVPVDPIVNPTPVPDPAPGCMPKALRRWGRR